MSSINKFSLKNLLAQLPIDSPVDLAWLATQNVHNSYAAKLARVGYLRKLGSGVYCAIGAKLEREACLAWLQGQIPDMHVASKTALVWRGVRHNISFNEKVVLWAPRQFKVPAWFSERFPVRHHTTHIFDEAMSADFGLGSAPGKPDKILVSVPERALLEMLSEVGTQIGSEEALNLVENARNLRREVLSHLLAHTNRVKVVRMAESFAHQLELPWLDLARQRRAQLGIEGRWVLSHPSSLESITLGKTN